jgi:hypothetical protein
VLDTYVAHTAWLKHLEAFTVKLGADLSKKESFIKVLKE